MKAAPALVAAAMFGLSACAQQQTGASGGIAVPAAPQAPAADMQTSNGEHAIFRIRVVDGRNGAALQGVHVTIWYDEAAGSGTVVTTDARGTAAMPAPVGEPVRVLVHVDDLMDCRRRSADQVPTGFNLQAIATHGSSADNSCGGVAQRARQGELVLFARPLRWYEGLNRGAGS